MILQVQNGLTHRHNRVLCAALIVCVAETFRGGKNAVMENVGVKIEI